MAMGWVRAGFFHTRTRPTSQTRRLRLGPVIKRIFFNPKPTLSSLRGPHPHMPSQAQNQKHKFWFMNFRPKITYKNTNPNTITNINTEIPNTNVKSMIFPFKITNQTKILDQWFSLSKSQTQTHMIETNWTQKKEKKMEIEPLSVFWVKINNLHPL